MEEELVPLGEIVAYWLEREEECGLGVDWAEAHERCWRCAPTSRGSSDVTSSLLPVVDLEGRRTLSYSAGDVTAKLRTFPIHASCGFGFGATCVSFYDLYWTVRGSEEFGGNVGRPPFTGPDFSKDLVSRGARTARGRDRSGRCPLGRGPPQPFNHRVDLRDG